MMEVKLKGIDTLVQRLEKNTDLTAIVNVVKKNGADLERKMKTGAPVDTGFLRRSIKADIWQYQARVKPTADYAPYLEYGTRYMNAQPFVRPAYQTVKKVFIEDLRKLVK